MHTRYPCLSFWPSCLVLTISMLLTSWGTGYTMHNEREDSEPDLDFGTNPSTLSVTTSPAQSPRQHFTRGDTTDGRMHSASCDPDSNADTYTDDVEVTASTLVQRRVSFQDRLPSGCNGALAQVGRRARKRRSGRGCRCIIKS